MAGKRIHPTWVVPGGVNEPLTAEKRDLILAGLPEAMQIARRTLEWFKSENERFREEIRTFANFPSLFMGLVGEDGGLEHYDGKLRFLDAGGHVVADGIDGASYADHIAELAHPWTYLKSSFYKPMGYPEGIYRVGRWRGLTSSTAAARRAPTRSGPSSASWIAERCSVLSITTMRA